MYRSAPDQGSRSLKRNSANAQSEPELPPWRRGPLFMPQSNPLRARPPSTILRAAFDNTECRLDGPERYVVGHNRLG